jgi:acyl carrier protein
MHRPMSYEQHGMWVAQDLRGQSNTSFSVRPTYRILGSLDVTALTGAFSDLVARHEPLRTRFEVRHGELVQVVADPAAFSLPVEPVPELAEAERAAWLRRRAVEIHAAGFDLETGPLLQAHLFVVRPGEHVLLLRMHQLAGDGWSMGVLNHDLAALYEARVQGGPAGLPELTLSYTAWAQAARRAADQDEGEALAYWREQLSALPADRSLPTDRPAPPGADYRGEHVAVEIDAATMTQAAVLARSEHVSSFMVLLAAFGVLAGRWTGQREVLAGIAVANRSVPGTEELIGCFAGVLPARLTADADLTFAEVLRRTRDVLLDGQENEIPVERIVGALPGLAREPLFRIGVSSADGLAAPLRLAGAEVSRLPDDVRYAPYDLEVTLATGDGRGRLGITFPFALFDRQTVQRLLRSYAALLSAACGGPAQPVSALPAPDLSAPADTASTCRPGPGAEPAGTPRPPARPTAAQTGDEALEELVRSVWRKALDVEPTGTDDDDFFLLGGSSLSAVRVSAELSDALGFKVPLRSIYEFSALTELTERLGELQEEYASVGHGPVSDEPAG